MRFERKYRIEEISLPEVMMAVRSHPLSFTTLYPDRQVNNIYLDTPNMSFFRENLSGAGQRRKYRLRWYGEDSDTAMDPMLEIKIKDNELGSKEFYPMKGELDIKRRQPVIDFVREQHYTQFPLEPMILSSYVRSYYTSYDDKFRLTVDRKLLFASLDHGMNGCFGFIEDPALVVEIKYEEEFDEEWSRVSNFFPFRVTKNSKYVSGIMLTVNV